MVGARPRRALPHELSGGEAAARSIAPPFVNPRPARRDEPTGTSTQTLVGIMQILYASPCRGGDRLMVTHDARWGQDAKRVIALEDGGCPRRALGLRLRMIASGRPRRGWRSIKATSRPRSRPRA